MSKFLISTVLIAFFGLLFLFVSCTIFPHLKRSFGLNETIEFHSSSGNEVSLNKALFANACNIDESFCLKDVILVMGRIDQGTIDSIEKLLSKGKSDTICFRTPGGNIDSAVVIGKWIDKNNFNTCLAEKYLIKGRGSLESTTCASACPFIFAMGDERISIGSDIKIGIHRSGGTIDFCFFCFDVNAFDYVAINKFKQMLDRKDRPESGKHLLMLEDSLEVEFSDIKFLSHNELENYEFFTKKI